MILNLNFKFKMFRIMLIGFSGILVGGLSGVVIVKRIPRRILGLNSWPFLFKITKLF